MAEKQERVVDPMVDKGLERISELLNKPKTEISPEKVISIKRDRMDLVRDNAPDIEPYTKERLMKAFGQIKVDNGRKWKEIIQSFIQSADLIDGGKPEGNSYGIFLPSYKAALEKQKENWGKKKDYKSLLIGSLTKETAIEYKATVSSIFPQAQTYFMDLEGEETRKTPDFILANGLSIPFRDNVFSSIHTNYLFHMLEGDNKPNDLRKIKRLLKESWRVLSVGGQLMMCEGNLGSIFFKNKSIESEIKKTIQQQGFSDISINQAVQFTSRRDMVNYLDPENILPINKIPTPQGVFMVTATKK